jgi:hypothetical protein
MTNSSSNGGFPPIKIIRKNNSKKDKFNITPKKDLNIKQILTDKNIKPMIETNKKTIDVIDSL